MLKIKEPKKMKAYSPLVLFFACLIRSIKDAVFDLTGFEKVLSHSFGESSCLK
jgi:hypothetical protein